MRLKVEFTDKQIVVDLFSLLSQYNMNKLICKWKLEDDLYILYVGVVCIIQYKKRL